jgi:hypothetical protein
MNKASAEMIAAYGSGLTVKQVAAAFNISTGKMYYLLRNAKCQFRSRGLSPGWHMPQNSIEKSASKRRGQTRSPGTRARISEARKCNFNGMNGFGHTKPHQSGYVLAYVPMHPNAHKDGYVMLHTVLMERSIGRYLKSNEVVHHINHDRSDNRPENLLLMDKREHMSMHAKERTTIKEESLSIV